MTLVSRPLLALFCGCICVHNAGLLAQTTDSAAETDQRDADRFALFETKIRPVLIEYCQDCHATDTEASGGLLLDSRQGWQAGGDSGAAIVAGNPSESRLLHAIRYQDPHLQMPPDEKLSAEIIQDFETWIAAGAADPREGEAPQRQATGLPVDRAQEFWSYRSVEAPALPEGIASDNAIDFFVNRRLEEQGFHAAPPAGPLALIRRLYFDLIGMPPTRQQVEQFRDAWAHDPELTYRRTVDRLLASPHYGEHFARRWMDVVRYADSITLRGFVLPNAWRYRDYLVQSFGDDKPFAEMIREQLAGDLMPTTAANKAQEQAVATGFLALGNTNLEKQDKTQLEMDFIDEQLDVICRAFLGQTIGCARCHDHKFDPIPTSDYYALAGILRSTKALEHANVSAWIDRPLPLSAEAEQHFTALLAEQKSVDKSIAELQKQLKHKDGNAVSVESLQGLAIDDEEAELKGAWAHSDSVKPFVNAGYHYCSRNAEGQAEFPFEAVPEGEYALQFSYTPHPNRASNTLVQVYVGNVVEEFRVNQKKTPNEDGVFQRLTDLDLAFEQPIRVVVSSDQADGAVVVDCVWLQPMSDTPTSELATSSEDALVAEREERKKLEVRLGQLQKRQKSLKAELAERPQYLTVMEEGPGKDIPIHVRGDVHNLGEVVPRGFLTAVDLTQALPDREGSVTRRELAEWIAADSNPLTARVYANRVWLWLMGRGIVDSPNNFGTTGQSPSHPLLLDWLAGDLIRGRWSTKSLVRRIVLSDAYRRQAYVDQNGQWSTVKAQDPNNQYYWRGHRRRLSAEALRDAMLSVSGELDLTMGGSLIPPGTKADYDFQHTSTRRSLYHPVFRNSLPELYEAFDFADPSMPIGKRNRSTVATQGLALMNHPWVEQRANQASLRLIGQFGGDTADNHVPVSDLVNEVYWASLGRAPSHEELDIAIQFLSEATPGGVSQPRLTRFIQGIFASIDFRYLD